MTIKWQGVKCGNCGKVFQFDRNSVTVDGNIVYAIQCPGCTMEVDVQKEAAT